jgi:putative ABC transport system ATP-binding protein
VSLEVATGEFLCVMGPSGSGKSTLLNLVAGLDSPNRGRVMVAGAELDRLDDDARSDLRLRAIGFVFQAFHLFPSFTVEENVAWPLEFQGVRWAYARLRAAEVLEQVGIPRAAHRRRPAELSGGEQQRVAIARALVAEPELLLADEPTGNLDSRTGETILDLLSDLNGERRLTVLMVTHSPQAATYADRTVEMCDGRVARDVRARQRL